jgi:hypothetical protein
MTKKKVDGSSFDLTSAIILLSFGPSLLELLKSISSNIQRKKNTKHEIGGGERNLPLGLLLSTLEKPQPKIKEESHIIHFETLRITFCKK